MKSTDMLTADDCFDISAGGSDTEEDESFIQVGRKKKKARVLADSPELSQKHTSHNSKYTAQQGSN